jgi:hypothetical protein
LKRSTAQRKQIRFALAVAVSKCKQEIVGNTFLELRPKLAQNELEISKDRDESRVKLRALVHRVYANSFQLV